MSKFWSLHVRSAVQNAVAFAVLIATVNGLAAPGCPGVLIARDRITLNSSYVDSFDSRSPSKSYFGHYFAPWYSGDRCLVTANGTNEGTITLVSSRVYGQVSVGPGGNVAMDASSAIGSHAWQTNHPGEIEANGTEQKFWLTDDAKIPFTTISWPTTEGKSPAGAADIASPSYLVSSSNVTSLTFPPFTPNDGVVTNAYVTNVFDYPGPQLALMTNMTQVTNATYPTQPLPGGIVTNYLGQYNASGPAAPAPGTYVPGTLIIYGNNGAKLYIWKGFTSKSYIYSVAASYSYIFFSYTYTIYATNVLWTTNHYDHILSNGIYTASTLAGKTIVTGNAELILPEGLHMSGHDSIEIPGQSSLRILAGGSDCNVGGNGIINGDTFAASLSIICADSVTNFTFIGNGEFLGTILAPEAKVTLNGGGHADNDFTGAIMAREIIALDHYSFHFDEDLLPPNLLTMTRSPSGECRIQVPAYPGYGSVLQCSSNMVDWAPIATNGATFEFVDVHNSNTSSRFYRSVQFAP